MGFYRKRVLPWLLDHVMWRPEIQEQRRALLGLARGRVLEIGFGTGASLPVYGAAARDLTCLVAVEPNPGMMRRARRRRAPSPCSATLVLASAQALPFRDDSFDTVVSMWTLCSVRDAHTALREVRRVLASSGRFLFLEHGRAAEPGIARWQDRLTPIQRRLAGGCHLNRPVDHWVREAGFELESLERYRFTPGPKVATQMYRGAARPV